MTYYLNSYFIVIVNMFEVEIFFFFFLIDNQIIYNLSIKALNLLKSISNMRFLYLINIYIRPILKFQGLKLDHIFNLHLKRKIQHKQKAYF